MKRVVVLGRGAAGKSTLAARLGEMTGLPVVELDQLFWQPNLPARERDEWESVQRELTRSDAWILDGDLGPHDVLGVRLRAADTVIVLDFSLLRCAARAMSRSREHADFWRWLWGYRRRNVPQIMQLIDRSGEGVDLYVLRNPHEVRRFLSRVASGPPG